MFEALDIFNHWFQLRLLDLSTGWCSEYGSHITKCLVLNPDVLVLCVVNRGKYSGSLLRIVQISSLQHFSKLYLQQSSVLCSMFYLPSSLCCQHGDDQYFIVRLWLLLVRQAFLTTLLTTFQRPAKLQTSQRTCLLDNSKCFRPNILVKPCFQPAVESHWARFVSILF